MNLAFKHFSQDENKTWTALFNRQMPLRDQQIHPIFSRGVNALGLTEKGIPSLDVVNTRLKNLTGFTGVPVSGLEEPEHVFKLLSEKHFPIGNFIREPKDLSYTPAPDVFHDMYGHIPYFADKDYAVFCENYGKKALELRHLPDALIQFDRLFWFTIEFALIKTPKGNRIFGAGITSSFMECEYALSDKPDVQPFNLDIIRHQDFRIDELQKRLFILENEAQLYSCLGEFEKLVRSGL